MSVKKVRYSTKASTPIFPVQIVILLVKTCLVCGRDMKDIQRVKLYKGQHYCSRSCLVKGEYHNQLLKNLRSTFFKPYSEAVYLGLIKLKWSKRLIE